MDSDDDYQSLSPPNQLSPQVQFRRLKRLKKSDDKLDPLFDSTDDPILFSHVDFAKLEELENDSEPQIFDESNSTDEANLSQESLSQGVENELDNGDKMELRLDVEVKKTKRMLEFVDDVVGGNDESGGKINEDGENFEPDKKKERIGEEEDLLEKKKDKKKKQKRENDVSGDGLKTNSRGSYQRREKERKTYLAELHAESQRLLRERGDASFKPIPVVQKPISSVLEKIRKRKLEISKKSMTSNDSYHGFEENIRRDGLMDLDRSEEGRLEENAALTVEKDIIALSLDVQNSLAASNVDEEAAAKATNYENSLNQVSANEEPIPAFRAPVDDTQDLFDDSEPTNAIIAQDDEKPNSPLEENFNSSLQAMNLKLESGPLDDSSSEEDNDKENFNPHPCGVADNSSPNGDPVKNFIDEEAEEEDDSDNDLNRFQENEADEDIDDSEELNDLIATEYEERTTDKERRNELHQKWLEQQDAAGTDNLMQRLKCGSVLKDAFLTDNEHETDVDDEMDEEIDDEAEEDSLTKESGKINVKKAKQIILQLYSGKEDTYLSDDDNDGDDDMQRRRVQCLIRKEEQAQIALPADDASSREVFGLIKNLNIASDNKKKPKAISIFDSILKGGSSVQSSKSSFLGRASNRHIPSSHKQGSATVRSFIFGRDDSNSRSSISTEEGSSDSVSRENRPTRNITTKYSSSQTKVMNQTTDSGGETISRTSLLEVLKRSSSRSKVCNEESGVDLTKSIFGFRAPKKVAKIQGRS